jgi:hypothetical protein
LKQQHAPSAARTYVRLLHWAAQEGETRVEAALRQRLKYEQALSFEVVAHLVKAGQAPEPVPQVLISPADLKTCDSLLLAARGGEVAHV